METNKSRKQAEKEFRRFARRHLLKPRNCRNMDQTRFYIFELQKKIKELKLLYGYVPDAAHLLSSQYQHIQDRLVYRNFQASYATQLC